MVVMAVGIEPGPPTYKPCLLATIPKHFTFNEIQKKKNKFQWNEEYQGLLDHNKKLLNNPAVLCALLKK